MSARSLADAAAGVARQSGRDQHRVPAVAAALGYGGALPFLLLVPAIALDGAASLFWADALLAYGAVILSFVGALHWAFAMSSRELDGRQRSQRYMWSVVPALVAWIAQLLAPAAAGLLLATGFALHYLQDRQLARLAALPPWYLFLRARLTLVAVTGMIALALLA